MWLLGVGHGGLVSGGGGAMPGMAGKPWTLEEPRWGLPPPATICRLAPAPGSMWADGAQDQTSPGPPATARTPPQPPSPKVATPPCWAVLPLGDPGLPREWLSSVSRVQSLGPEMVQVTQPSWWQLHPLRHHHPGSPPGAQRQGQGLPPPCLKCKDTWAPGHRS